MLQLGREMSAIRNRERAGLAVDAVQAARIEDKVLSHTIRFCFAKVIAHVVLQESVPTQIRQRILYITNGKG